MYDLNTVREELCFVEHKLREMGASLFSKETSRTLIIDGFHYGLEVLLATLPDGKVLEYYVECVCSTALHRCLRVRENKYISAKVVKAFPMRPFTSSLLTSVNEVEQLRELFK